MTATNRPSTRTAKHPAPQASPQPSPQTSPQPAPHFALHPALHAALHPASRRAASVRAPRERWLLALTIAATLGLAGCAAAPADHVSPGYVASQSDLASPAKKELAMQLVSSAENSSLDWKAQYAYIEDIGDGRGYTAGIIGFCSGTGDMLELVQAYTKSSPDNPLAAYLPALESVNGSDSHEGLDPGFAAAWGQAAADPAFQASQDDERDRVYFDPAVSQAKKDGLGALGQFIYYDAMVMHGPGADPESFGGIRKSALAKATTPARGGDEVAFLNAFLDERVRVMKLEDAHDDTSRVDDEQRKFLREGNLNLDPPLSWKTYGDGWSIP